MAAVIIAIVCLLAVGGVILWDRSRRTAPIGLTTDTGLGIPVQLDTGGPYVAAVRDVPVTRYVATDTVGGSVVVGVVDDDAPTIAPRDGVVVSPGQANVVVRPTQIGVTA